MNAEEFVKAVRIAIVDTASRGTIDLLSAPPGRRPDQELLKLSKWYCGLTPENRSAVEKVVELVADQAAYNFLLALDGLLTLESGNSKGNLELFFARGAQRTRLNDKSSEELSALFKAK